MTTRTRNARGDGARLRDEILDAATALVDDGDLPLSLRGVARRAGISAPSIYAHFADLDALVAAMLAQSFRDLEASVAAATTGDPAEALRAAGLAYVSFGWAHRDRYRLMFAATGYAPDAVDLFVVVEDLIAACVAAGLSTSTDPHADAFLLWVALHGMATLEKPGRDDYLRLGPLDRPAAVRTLVDRLGRLV